ncbi:head-tail adaptor [Stenotrophomonas sp. AN71]|uniref:head-tail adaptor protein n=1 Tax=Stenotrophomonas sp. AN71 TaxID=3156253 RepID=UPI003D1F898E
MNAGHFNRRIRIERQDGRLDAWGQPLDTWQPVGDLWAGITADASGGLQRLTLESRLPATLRRQRFHVRLAAARQAGIQVGMRIVHDGRIFDITGVAPDFSRRQTTVLFTEQSSGTA